MSRKLIWLWIFFSLSTLVAAKPSETDDNALSNPTRAPTIAAWIQRTRGVAGPLSVIIAPRITAYNELSPHSYTIERDGSLTINNPVADAVLVDFARLNGIKMIPTVSSGWENGARIYQILRDPKLRAAHLNAILSVARSSYLDGIDLDYENLPPDARQAYSDFVAALASALHRAGKILSVTVPPKIGADDSCVTCKFADYAALGAVADRFRVMGYEYRGKTNPPGAIAPIWWLRQLMNYTVTQVPRAKIILGIHLYGYDWGGKETPALWWNEVMELKEKWSGEIRAAEPDARGIVGENVMTYSLPAPSPRCSHRDLECAPTPREKHTIYFVDARYVSAAWEIVNDFRLGGIVLWRPGGEDPAMWDALRNGY